MLKNAIFCSLHVNISNSIKSEITGIFSHNNNISVWLGTFIQSDTYRLSTRNVLLTRRVLQGISEHKLKSPSSIPRLRCLCTESSVKRQYVLNTYHLSPPKSYCPPFVIRDAINCQIRNAAPVEEISSMVGLFWLHLLFYKLFLWLFYYLFIIIIFVVFTMKL